MALPSSNDAVERAVLGLCGALSGCVALEPSSPPCSAAIGLCAGRRPVPRIVVRFASDSHASRPEQLSLVLRRLEAVGALSAVAACRAFTWRRNPLFWLRVLQHCCQVRHCGEYFDSRAIACADAMAPAADADPREAPACARSQADPRARRAGNQRAAVATFAWQQEEGSERTYSAQECEVPSFLLDFSYADLAPQVLSALRRLLMARAKARKPAWRFSYIKTVNLLGCVARPKRVLSVKIALRFNQCRLQEGVTLTALRDLLSDVNQRHERSRAAVCTYARFVPTATPKHSPRHGQAEVASPTEWEWLSFAVTHLDVSGSALGSKDFKRLADIVARSRGSPLRELVLNQVFVGVSSPQLLPAFASLMSECFRPSIALPQRPGDTDDEHSEQEDGHTARQRTIRHLSLDSNSLAEFHLASLFTSVYYGSTSSQRVTTDDTPSVLSSCSGARELSLQNAFRGFQGDPTRPWLWLAFGIYHAQSQSQVTHLNISRNVLRPEAVRAAKMLVDLSLTPYAEAFSSKKSSSKSRGRSNSSSEERKPSPLSCQRALLAADTHLWPSPEQKAGKTIASVTAARTHPQLKTNDACWCHVLSLDPRWTCLLVPGFGRFWAKSEKILRVSVPPEADLDAKRVERFKLTKLDMNAMLSGEEDVAVRGALIPWIRLVGRPLLALHLRSNALLESDLAVILQSCPSLTLLDVEDCALPGIRPIIAGFADESCRVETLNLAENKFPTRDIVDLSRELRGSDDSRGDRPPRLIPAAVPPLAVLHLELNPLERVSYKALLRVMTSGNKTLRLLSLDKAHVADRELEYRLSQCDGEALGLHPLSPSHRAALLSVVQSIPSAQHCDGPVLSLIAGFAAESVQRQVVWR